MSGIVPIILGVITCAINATMDEIRFHWGRLFGHWFKPDTKLEQWFNPAKSWTNKYISNSRILTYLFSGPLVMFTDFWHFLKFIVINNIFIIIIYLDDPTYIFKQYVFILIFLNVLWGLVFQGTFGIWGWLSEKYRNLKK